MMIGCVLSFVIGVSAFIGIQYLKGETYKDGQIDALSGKVKYVLVQKSESVWQEIKK